MPKNDLTKYGEEVHRRRGISAGLGATVGGIGSAVGVAVGEKSGKRGAE